MNKRKHGPWTIVDSDLVYSDPWIEVTCDQVIRPDGAPGSYSTVRLKSGVSVLAVGKNNQVHLTREFHYAVGRVTVEAVSGGIEADEPSQLAAERELAEELGFKARTWSYLGRLDPFTSAIHSTVDLYLAEDLEECPKNPEGTELIDHVAMDLYEAIDLIGNEITHSPTCVLLMMLDRRLKADQPSS
jgi:ADP-ribose pyrophosphatase